MPPFEIIHYIPRSQKEAMRNLKVVQIQAVGHSKQTNHKGGFTNHWCIYLQVDSGFVCVNMVPSHIVAGKVLVVRSSNRLSNMT